LEELKAYYGISKMCEWLKYYSATEIHLKKKL
jgi:hypothetical protein